MNDFLNNFNKLNSLTLDGKLETKKTGKVNLTYLSWAFAWGEFVKVYPDATYKIREFTNPNGTTVPYQFDEFTGYMCWTEITAGGVTHLMFLPVMDGANNAMKDHEYTYSTKFGDKKVDGATMFDVNKTIMRCLVKNMAMFGLGLWIYAGEDLPPDSPEVAEQKVEVEKTRKGAYLTSIADIIELANIKAQAVINYREGAYIEYMADIVSGKNELSKEDQDKCKAWLASI
jgi:hypothetical protein